MIIDDDVPDAKTKHGVLVYGSNIAIPFQPKYLSMNVDTSKYLQKLLQTLAIIIRKSLLSSDAYENWWTWHFKYRTYEIL